MMIEQQSVKCMILHQRCVADAYDKRKIKRWYNALSALVRHARKTTDPKTRPVSQGKWARAMAKSTRELVANCAPGRA